MWGSGGMWEIIGSIKEIAVIHFNNKVNRPVFHQPLKESDYMRTRIRLLVLLILVVSCNQQPQDQTDQSQSNKTNSSLTIQQLQNAEYHTSSTADDRFQLTDGEYRKKFFPDSASERIVRLSDNVAGNLDNTDGEDAAVILIENSGGSGTFYHLGLSSIKMEIP